MKYYQKIQKSREENEQTYKRIEDDGTYKFVCTGECPEYLEWVDKGNTAKEVDYTDQTVYKLTNRT